MWRVAGCLLLSVLVGILGGGHPARAQDEAEPEEEQPAPPKRAFVLTDDQIEIWLLGGVGGADKARRYLESYLAKQINRIDVLSRLTPEQKKKLEAAGRGDLKRFFDRIEEAKQAIHCAQEDINEVRAIMTRLNQSLRNPLLRNPGAYLFGETSLFAKTLEKTLTTEQRAEQRAKDDPGTYRTRVEWMVSSLDFRLGLSPEQHERFVSVIAKETRPLQRYGSLDDQAVLLQASKLPEAKIRSMFDAAQWRQLNDRFDQAKRMEKILISEGYLPENEHGDTHAVPAKTGAWRRRTPVRGGPLLGKGFNRQD
jgi:hypothetical protein